MTHDCFDAVAQSSDHVSSHLRYRGGWLFRGYRNAKAGRSNPWEACCCCRYGGFPGASADQVESLVTIKLEQQLRGIGEIAQVRSNSRAGISTLIVELRDDVYEVDPVWSKMQDRLADVEPNLPEGCRPPVIEVFPMKAFAAILAVKPLNQNLDFTILRRLAGELAMHITNLSGTEGVEIFGDPGEEFVAEIQPRMLARLRLPTAAIASQIATDGSTHPAGTLKGSTRLIVDVHDPEQWRAAFAGRFDHSIARRSASCPVGNRHGFEGSDFTRE